MRVNKSRKSTIAKNKIIALITAIMLVVLISSLTILAVAEGAEYAFMPEAFDEHLSDSNEANADSAPDSSSQGYEPEANELDSSAPEVSAYSDINFEIEALAEFIVTDWDELLDVFTNQMITDGPYTVSVVVGITMEAQLNIPTGRTVNLAGGGVLYQPTANARHFVVDGALILNDITLRGTGVAAYRGGISVNAGGELTMNDGSVIEHNRATQGGGVFVGADGIFTMNDGIIRGNVTSHWVYPDSSGGGVFVQQGTMTMHGGIISGNTSHYGGGIALERGIFFMNDGSISENEAAFGAGVYLSNESYFTMNDGIIGNNFAINLSLSTRAGVGGGVRVTFGSTFTMNGGNISRNCTNGGTGGGISLHSSTFIMNGGSVNENHAQQGAGVDSRESYVTMDDGSINDNVVVGRSWFPWSIRGYGGGISVSRGTFTMNGGTIRNNVAQHYSSNPWTIHQSKGGGVFITHGGSMIMNDGVITENTTHYGGGGVALDNGTFTMTGGAITSNTAVIGDGGGIFSGAHEDYPNPLTPTAYHNIIFESGTISGNTAGTGRYAPPINYYILPFGHLLNNHEINFRGSHRVDVTASITFHAYGVGDFFVNGVAQDYVVVPVVFGEDVTDQPMWAVVEAYLTNEVLEQGFAFWGWFLHNETVAYPEAGLNNTPQRWGRPILDENGDQIIIDGLVQRHRRPTVGAQGFPVPNPITPNMHNAPTTLVFTEERFNALASEDGSIHLHAIWSLWGDVNDDGYVNPTDANLLFQLVGLSRPAPVINTAPADVHRNGIINAVDTNILFQYVGLANPRPRSGEWAIQRQAVQSYLETFAEEEANVGSSAEWQINYEAATTDTLSASVELYQTTAYGMGLTLLTVQYDSSVLSNPRVVSGLRLDRANFTPNMDIVYERLSAQGYTEAEMVSMPVFRSVVLDVSSYHNDFVFDYLVYPNHVLGPDVIVLRWSNISMRTPYMGSDIFVNIEFDVAEEANLIEPGAVQFADELQFMGWAFGTGSNGLVLNDGDNSYVLLDTDDDEDVVDDNAEGTLEDSYEVPEVDLDAEEQESEEYEVEPCDAIEQFVIRLYDLVLDEAYDEESLENWSYGLRTGEYIGAEVAYAFFFSEEMLERELRNGQFVDILFRALLDREAEEEERTYLIDQLRDGVTRIEMFIDFVNSDEFEEFSEKAGMEHELVELVEPEEFSDERNIELEYEVSGQRLSTIQRQESRR